MKKDCLFTNRKIYKMIIKIKTEDSIIKHINKNYNKNLNIINNEIKYFLRNNRYYSSLSNLTKIERYLLLNKFYDEIDIVCCFISILNNICKLIDYEEIIFEDYKNNKKKYLTNLNIDTNYTDLKLKIIEKFNLKVDDQKKNKLSSCVSIFIFSYEKLIIEIIINKLKELNLEIGAILFDAIYIEKNNLNKNELIEILEKEIKDKINFNNIKLKYTELFEIETNEIIYRNNILKDEFYVDYLNFNTFKIVLIESALGSGKTTASIKFINEFGFEFEFIIILTPRISYAKNIFIEFKNKCRYKFLSYLDEQVLDKSCVVQIESLYKLSITDFSNSLVIIDECESCLFQLTSDKTNKYHHKKNIDKFEEIMKAKKIICLDAFISNKTLNLFRNFNLEFKHFKYTRLTKERFYNEIQVKYYSNKDHILSNIKKDKFYFLNYYKSFEEQIDKLLKINKKLFIFCSSKDKSEQIFNFININYSNLKVILFNSRLKNKDEIVDVNNKWVCFDVVISTSSITVGISFDILHFHSIVAYISSSSRNLVRDIFQNFYRVRNLKDNNLYYIIDGNLYGINNLSCDSSLIKKVVNNNINYNYNVFVNNKEKYLNEFVKNYHEIYLSYIDFNGIKTNIIESFKKNLDISLKDWFKDLFVDNLIETNKSIMHTKNLFDEFLERCNYKKFIQEEEEDIQDYLSFCTKTNNNFLDYNEIKDINLEEYKKLKCNINGNLEFSNILEIKKFNFKNIVKKNLDNYDDLWKHYNKNANVFFNVFYENGLLAGSIHENDLLVNKICLYENSILKKWKIIKEICNLRKINGERFFNCSYDDKSIITKQDLKFNLSIFERNYKNWYLDFDIRNQIKREIDTKQIIDIIDNIINKWNGNDFKMNGAQKRTRIKGNKVDVSEFKINGFEKFNLISNKTRTVEKVDDVNIDRYNKFR